MYTAELLFHQSPTRHSDYIVTTTVTMSLFSSPRHRDYRTVTTSDTYIIRYPLPWGLCRNPSSRQLHPSLHGKTLGTCYTQSLCRNQGGTGTQFCSLPPVPIVGERIFITSSLSSHSTVTTWGVLLCISLSSERSEKTDSWTPWTHQKCFNEYKGEKDSLVSKMCHKPMPIYLFIPIAIWPIYYKITVLLIIV